jgi:nitrite reductase/ring-hydroxylating ferredoxin subunit
MTWRATGIAAATIPVGGKREVTVEGRSVVIVRLSDGFFGLEGICPHLGGMLVDGRIDRDALVCPEHGATFEIRTGAVRADPDGIVPPQGAVPPLQRFPVRQSGAMLEIDA